MDTIKPTEFHSKEKFTCIKARHVLAIMCVSALVLNYALNVCMSVAIVAMVKVAGHATVIVTNYTDADVCPGGESEQEDSMQEGEFEWDEETQGYILSSYYYGYASTQVLGGRLAERFGGKHVIGSGIVLCGIFTLLIPWSAWTHVYFLMALRVLQGVGGGIVLPAMHCMFSKWFPPEERTQFSGVIFSAIHVGTVVAMSLTGVLADTGGWPVVFYFFGISAFVWYIPWIFLAYESPEQHPRISFEEKIYITEKLGSDRPKKVSLPVPWCSIFTSGPVWASFLMNFAITWEGYTLMTELPTYSKNILHFSVRESGFISALPYLFDYISSIAAGFLSRWLQSRGCMSKLTIYKIFNGLVAVGGSLGLYAITIAGCDSTLIMVLLILTLTTHGFYMGGSAINHMDLAINYAGTIAGISYTLSNLAGILAPSVAGIIINGQQTLTQWSLVFYIAIAVLVIPYLLFLIFGSADEQSWNQPKIKHQEEIIIDNVTGHANPVFSMESEIQENHNVRTI